MKVVIWWGGRCAVHPIEAVVSEDAGGRYRHVSRTMQGRVGNWGSRSRRGKIGEGVSFVEEGLSDGLGCCAACALHGL